MSSEGFGLVAVGSRRYTLRQDAKLWETVETLGGARVTVRVPTPDLQQALNGELKWREADPALHQLPGTEYRPPEEVVRKWTNRLLGFDTEALLVMGRNREGEWIGVVPRQEVSSSHVDVEDFGPSISFLRVNGYRRVGTLHTHPGASSYPSGIDRKELFPDFGGVHLIVSRTGVVTPIFACREASWVIRETELEGQEEWVYPELEVEGHSEEEPLVQCPDATLDIDKMVSKPVRVVTTTRRWSGWDSGRESLWFGRTWGEWGSTSTPALTRIPWEIRRLIPDSEDQKWDREIDLWGPAEDTVWEWDRTEEIFKPVTGSDLKCLLSRGKERSRKPYPTLTEWDSLESYADSVEEWLEGAGEIPKKVKTCCRKLITRTRRLGKILDEMAQCLEELGEDSPLHLQVRDEWDQIVTMDHYRGISICGESE